MLDQYNAGQQFFHAYLNDAVVYVNPYFTISRKNYTRHIFNGSQRIATEIGTTDLSNCIDTTAAGMERLAYARAYMQSLFADPIELHSDTGTTFVDIDGEAYDELQWQCFGGDRLWQITIACDSDILLPILRRDSGAADTRVSGKYFYHTDHLGSANWVTNGDEAVQFIHYMPYGEMWYNQRGSAYNERYKYTGKERDEETDNDYFGARYYAAYTPMWLSPDPLMDKYPGISPYAYCHWNPMKYVDPDGKDELEIQWNASKEIFKVKEIKNENYDQVHIVDAEGNRITSSNQYPYGIINNPRWGNYGDRKIFLFDIAGDENASSLFEFLGKNFTIDNNMPLEWSKVQVGYKNSGRNIIGTSMKKDATGVGHYILNWGYTIRGVDHNHPKGLPPSQKDKNNATLYHSKFPNATLRVFTGKEYLQYSGQSFVLPEFIVTPK